jgi:hypothetical protein
MQLTLIFVNAPTIEDADSVDVYRTVFELPDAVKDETDFEAQVRDLLAQVAELTTVSLYVTCRALRWQHESIKPRQHKERERAVWNATIFGFDQTNPDDPERGRYLKIPFAIVPPFEMFLLRGTRKRGSLRRAVRQPLRATSEDQRVYLDITDKIATICVSLLNLHSTQTWTYAGFHPDRFDVSLYNQYAKKDDVQEQARKAEYAFANASAGLSSASGQVDDKEQVYFIQQGDNGPIKIGYSADPQRRLQSLSTASPYPLRLLGVLDGDMTLEQTLHHRFADHQLEGEWFAPVPELLAFIAELHD